MEPTRLPINPFRIFVAGTDTGIGKTQAACALLSLLVRRKLAPAAFKPYESGCEDLRRPADAIALRLAARSRDPLDRICPHRFREPLAPGIAASRAGQQPLWSRTLQAYRSFAGRPLVAEAAGGLLVPVDDRRLVIDLPAAFRLPVLLVARAGLGTLNHVGLSLEVLKARKVEVAATLLAQSTPDDDLSQEDNPGWLRARYGLNVLGPVPYRAQEAARAAAFEEALSPWLEARLGRVR